MYQLEWNSPAWLDGHDVMITRLHIKSFLIILYFYLIYSSSIWWSPQYPLSLSLRSSRAMRIMRFPSTPTSVHIITLYYTLALNLSRISFFRYFEIRNEYWKYRHSEAPFTRPPAPRSYVHPFSAVVLRRPADKITPLPPPIQRCISTATTCRNHNSQSPSLP